MTDISKMGVNIVAAGLVLTAVIKFTVPIAQMQIQVENLEKSVDRIEAQMQIQPTTIKEIIEDAIKDLKE